jgi:hypothetical protein
MIAAVVAAVVVAMSNRRHAVAEVAAVATATATAAHMAGATPASTAASTASASASAPAAPAMTNELDHAVGGACDALQVKRWCSLCGQPDCRQQDQTACQSSGRCQVGFHWDTPCDCVKLDALGI